jgi:DNA repair protein RadB
MAVLKLRCEGLNKLLGGGIEHGIITNVYGVAGAGKTNFALEATISAIMNGKKVVFIDTERNFSPERFIQMYEKDKLSEVLIKEPSSFQQQHETILSLEDKLSKMDVGLVVVDSIVALYRIELKQDKIYEVNAMLSEQFITLAKLAKKFDIPVLVTNQVYSLFDSDEIELVGRDIPKYSSKCMILLEKLNSGKRRAVLVKHRHMPEGISVEFEITREGMNVVEPKKFGIFK